jgi:hypothetical protein
MCIYYQRMCLSVGVFLVLFSYPFRKEMWKNKEQIECENNHMKKIKGLERKWEVTWREKMTR